VAHNAAASHVKRSRKRQSKTLVSIEEIEESVEMGRLAAKTDANHSQEQTEILDRLYGMIHRLNPLDRQVILLYLEGVDAGSIGEVTGLSSSYVATKIHRIKAVLTQRFHNGANHDHK
jgi:RNA polymerase sigma-70 factor (ECF subfamily)